ncbi:hypothetical protein [uncultured Novosphingobium sp.]|uniref:hypothetical protein n=1 Tax=uncultured Novosphingobium sp. TaxID=292277 RepID=UPI002582BEFE|nr:hypothetical protein [uncultured Novosphingobium sp.]
MISIFNRAAMARVLTLDLAPQLRCLLERRFASLVTPWGDLTDWTEWIILEPGDGEDDIVCEVGFSPLIEPIDGARFGTTGFRPFWDHLDHEGGHFVMIQSFGSTFAYVLIIPDDDGIFPELLALCRQYAA